MEKKESEGSVEERFEESGRIVGMGEERIRKGTVV